MGEDFTPRNYQEELMKIGLDKNTIIFLPTGSGKTFIALMILKRMSGDLIEKYNDGGKITVILVNTIALVEQHSKYIRDHTTLECGQFTGDMSVDFWPRDRWNKEINKKQVLIMTCQIFVNIVNSNFVDLNKVNLLIFDECHRGVSDQPMRQLMKSFENLTNPPRVLGLTATLLNGNCKPHRVMQEVQSLETTYHSKVATVDGLDLVVGFSTNPVENFKICTDYHLSATENIVIDILEKVRKLITEVKIELAPLNLKGLKPLEPVVGYKNLANLIADLIKHIQIMGTYGGVKASLAHMIQCERLRKHCQDLNFYNLLSYVLTNISFVKELLMKSMKGVESEKEKIYRFSSDKVLKLISIFEEYKNISKEELCCIIFTTRRFTAKVIHHILDSLKSVDPDYSHLKPDFMVGYNNNPYNDTRECLYRNKKNKEILQNFCNKEVNVLVASNVLEEGVDIPKCTLVIKFDKPDDYRSYIQSKGRARHKDSLYYMIVERSVALKFNEKYQEFQLVEQTLNNYLVGKNIARPDPSQEEIENMYKEDELPPYYVDGPGSAQVNMRSAIPLLCQYCASLPSDIYTMYAPEWYVREKMEGGLVSEKFYSVVIMLPTICPIVEIIEGPYMKSIKSAKRAAALKACTMLHKIGELDDHLLPIKCEIREEDVSFLFPHYPSTKEAKAGYSKNKRFHKKQIAKDIQGQITPNTSHFLHVIYLEPQFSNQPADIHNSTIYDMYTSSLCFGIITPGVIPVLCDFPIYVSLGTINVCLKVNQKQIMFEEKDLSDIKEFHFLLFNDVLKILKQFLIFDNSTKAEMLLLVPLNRETLEIDFSVIRGQKSVAEVTELTSDEKLNLQVTQETFLNKIVSPWYRRDPATYIVTEVALNKSALSPFPNEDYSSFQEYFQEKHCKSIIGVHQPLLLVKGLTKRLNFIKPKGKQGKRKRDKLYEEMTEYLIAELVVKQDFPASLWIQASFLPTILYRISYMLQLEELRCKISKETRLQLQANGKPKPLELDEYLLDYEPHIEEQLPENAEAPNISVDETLLTLSSTPLHCNKDYAAKMLEAEYPWKDLDEPKDLERVLDVTLMDIEYYENFISHKVTMDESLLRNESPSRTMKQLLALTYHKDFVEKSIALLDVAFTNRGPELCEMYRALTTSKANDIVNLERLETLGDSFLKLIASIYTALRFPKYDEGRATTLKSRLVSNKNLYYLAKQRNLSGILMYNELSPKDSWLPPAFTVPEKTVERISLNEVSINSLFNLTIPRNEQITGNLSQSTINTIMEEDYAPDENEESSYPSMATFLKSQYIGDKHVADVVESLIGVYLQSSGIKGGIHIIQWIGIIPASEKLEELLRKPSPDPILNEKATMDKINFHLPHWQEIERILGYHFNNRAYLLQALTHSSYTPNRITLSYEKLEFLGDAVLDFLITCYIYESCGNLDPGQLTDLRSALVNNNTFASLLVRCGFHKFLLMINSQLQGHIDKFDEYLKSKNYEINDEVLILMEEDELNLAEYVDVPKVLGDVFEALAGAVFLDSGKDLKTVWKVFYKIMWKEIDLFSRNIPKNIIRRLFEFPGAHPEFGNAMATANNKSLVALQFMLNGRQKVVHGCGTNKTIAKRAAAKLALRSLEK